MLIEQANKGTRLNGPSSVEGYASDNPRTEAQYECELCFKVKDESDMWNDQICKACSGE